jgi:hypothetical protein
MNTTYRYLAVDGEGGAVRDWFDGLDPSPVTVHVDRGAWLHFGDAGPLVFDATGNIEVQDSPLVSVFPSRRVRGVLWTAGEVHFVTKGLRHRYPGLDQVRRQFDTWMNELDLVYDGRPGEFDFLLEGSIRNFDSPLFAFGGAAAALRSGSYFVSEDDSGVVLDDVCRRLALRDVRCLDEIASG